MNRRDILKLAPGAAVGLVAGCGSDYGVSPLHASLPPRPASKAPRQVNIVHAFLWFEPAPSWRQDPACARVILQMAPKLKATSASITVLYDPALMLRNLRVLEATIFEDENSVTLLWESHRPFTLDLFAEFDFCFVEGVNGGFVWIEDAEFELPNHGQISWATVPPIWLAAPR